MKLMSFMLTKAQFRNRTKTVTRRIGWRNAKPGDRYEGVEKGQGLKKGEKVVRMGIIEVVSALKEPLCRMTDDPEYGQQEVIKEGFPQLTPNEFVTMFCEHNQCVPEKPINRIEFKYIVVQ